MAFYLALNTLSVFGKRCHFTYIKIWHTGLFKVMPKPSGNDVNRNVMGDNATNGREGRLGGEKNIIKLSTGVSGCLILLILIKITGVNQG